ncbi:MAG: hypothetical protein WCF82_15970 [Microcoleus sp.]
MTYKFDYIVKIVAGGESGRSLFCSPHSDADGKRAIAFLSKLRSLQQLRFILVFGRRVNIVPLAI